jgi:nucleoside 2-deoxyribosyltransferase
MNAYEKFCQLRDYRNPGTEALRYTEAEAFALSVAREPAANSATRLYLAGPMSGIAQLNFPKFHAEAARLRSLGFEVVNPVELNNEDPDMVFANDQEQIKHWQRCLRVDIGELLHCDSVALLDGWTASKGARLEQHVAFELGMAPRLAAFFVEPAERATKYGGAQHQVIAKAAA